MIVYNKGTKPIYIMTDMVRDPFGGPGAHEVRYIVGPGQGIDLSILGLSPLELAPVEYAKAGADLRPGEGKSKS